MENQPAIISFLLPHDVQLVATDISFWDTIHKQGTEIDRLPGFGHDLAMALVDWLVAEFGISQLWASNASLCPNTLVLGQFDRHETQCASNKTCQTHHPRYDNHCRSVWTCLNCTDKQK